MSRLISGIIFAACIAAVGRGIVFAFGLDFIVAQGIQRLTNIATKNIQAVAWVISGSLALLAFLTWTTLHLDQKLSTLFSSKPMIGSLPSTGQILRISRHVSKDTTSVEIVVDLHNTNSFLIEYDAHLTLEVNGSAVIMANGDDFVLVHGYIAANKSVGMIMRQSEFKAPIVDGLITVECKMRYDVKYYPANEKENFRRTAKTLIIGRIFPATQPIGTEAAVAATFDYSNEIEE
jgi:hypothetical protein